MHRYENIKSIEKIYKCVLINEMSMYFFDKQYIKRSTKMAKNFSCLLSWQSYVSLIFQC